MKGVDIIRKILNIIVCIVAMAFVIFATYYVGNNGLETKHAHERKIMMNRIAEECDNGRQSSCILYQERLRAKNRILFPKW